MAAVVCHTEVGSNAKVPADLGALCRLAVIAAAEAAAAAAAEEQLAAAVTAHHARVSELESEVHRLRSSAQTYLRDEREVIDTISE